MDPFRTLPPISGENRVTFDLPRVSPRSRNKSKSSSESSYSSTVSWSPRVAEFVSEDVFLMDNKTRRVTTNLLANSLTARLRKNLPDSSSLQNDTIKRIRRDSLKDFVRLDHLNKRYNSEMQRENSRLDKESYQLLKRQKQMQKQSEMQRRKQEKLEASLRSRSGLSSASLFPLLATGRNSEQGQEGFPEFASVDKDDQSHVKVFKFNGVYQPTNKYSSRIEPFETTPKHNLNILGEQENSDNQETRRSDNSPIDLPPKSRMSKKALRVSWSRQSTSKYFQDDELDLPLQSETREVQADAHSEMVSPDRFHSVRSTPKRQFNSRLSTRSDTYLIQASKHFKGRRKIETIGLKWKIPPGKPAHSVPDILPIQRPARATTPTVSHNLRPVTTAMEREGTSPKHMCWQVQKSPKSMTTKQVHQSWLGKLELLKGSESMESGLNIPNRANLSVMTHLSQMA